MKTTIDIAEPLLRRAKVAARKQKRSLRDLVESGLRRELALAREARGSFELRDASVGGEGLRPELRGASFAELLELSYGDRG